ncbi:hypothetical protein NHX12_034269 [Muraenolepis orangiensis]|uniref:C2H2-type domain-containing protein n=1 Tax=Muraenolepis orangiensis TaxID=630683 RepID=A0A9Q0D2X1_9TELE|nr:hypothetical protein NHX12_034269 [Muraenolepis orangiensis]
MDPVQKAVINHTFGVAPPKRKSVISCNICHLRFNSMTQAEAHYKGHKHARKLTALVGQRGPQRSRQRAAQTAGREAQKERGRTEGGLRDTQHTEGAGLQVARLSPKSPLQQVGHGPAVLLALPPSQSAHTTPASPELHPQVPTQSCSPPADALVSQGALVVYTGPLLPSRSPDSTPNPQGISTLSMTVNSNSQLEAHCLGSRHKQMLDGQSGGSTQLQRRVKVTSSPRPACRTKSWIGLKTRAGASPVSRPFNCELCQLSVNSESQLKQHMSSRRHKERVSGKASKPKFTPYAKIQPSTLLATKLALQKHLSKALPPGFLHNPFNPAALCTLASGPLALRGLHGPSAFFQGPLIGPTLFRPAPGPLRATHTPIIFSPY